MYIILLRSYLIVILDKNVVCYGVQLNLQYIKFENVIKQGGVISAILPHSYIDPLPEKLKQSVLGCYINSVHVLSYAEDVA